MESVLLYLIDHFPDLMDINLTASIVIAFVICVRQFLKRAPKIFSYALWGIVLLRLLVPVSIESPMSFVPERTEFSSMVQINEVLPEIQFETPEDRADNAWYLENTPPGEPFVQVSRSLDAETYLTFLWLFGIAGMLLYSFVSCWKLRRKLKVVVPYRKGIFLADDIDTPFVMGIIRPKIYLPGSLDPAERKYIIAHERHHIKRGDHIFKALGFLTLTIHWFNPLVWVAFVLAGRDMEMSCDEAVIRKLGEDVRAEYSASLLNLATGKRIFSGTPLAFDEGDPAQRVRNLAKWKRPALWVVLLCVIICMILAVCLLTDPSQDKPLEDMTMIIGPASVGVGDLEFKLPEGFAISLSDEQTDRDLYAHIIWKGHAVVGGVYKLKNEALISRGTWDWVSSLNIPENVPEERFMMSVDYYAEYMSDLPYYAVVSYGKNGIVETNHYLFNRGDPVYDIWFDMEALSEEEIARILDTARIVDPAESIISGDWGVSIQPDRVSRTGATALFVYSGTIPGEEGAELTYGDFLSLDRLVDGAWVPCDELAGYDYYVGDSSYPVVDGYGMVHEWPDRFGELTDGRYRLGKQVTLIRADGSTESRMVYGEFSIPDSVLTGPIPLENLPDNYGAEQAMLDGCVVLRDGDVSHNQEVWQAFLNAVNAGQEAYVRTAEYHYYPEISQATHYVYDIHFNGRFYTVEGMLNGEKFRKEYQYMLTFLGQASNESHDYDSYIRYVLSNEPYESWNKANGITMDGSITSEKIPQVVYTDLIYETKHPQLPANPAQAVLEFNGAQLVSITDFDRLEKIWILFEDAELLGYEPKTHSVGIGLNLILTSQNGETMTIELDPDSDICRINGEYVFYGAYDEPDYIEKLWYYLGIPSWPDSVYEMYPNAYRP